MTDISVVVPMRNAAGTLRSQLRALDQQLPGSPPFEVVLADNGSTDSTIHTISETSVSYPLRVVDASERAGVSHARNVGIRAARGELIMVCDADDEVRPGWVAAFARANELGAELMGGRLDYRRLNAETTRAWRGAEHATVMMHRGFLPFAHGACCAFTRGAFEAAGGFDEELLAGGDDIAFFWRAQLAGYELVTVDDAVVDYRLRSTVPAAWRQALAYGRSDPALYARFRADGMRRRPALAVLRSAAWLVRRSPWLLDGDKSRGAWLWAAAHQLGRIEGSIRSRVVYL